jgi:hypothetical protein
VEARCWSAQRTRVFSNTLGGSRENPVSGRKGGRNSAHGSGGANILAVAWSHPSCRLCDGVDGGPIGVSRLPSRSLKPTVVDFHRRRKIMKCFVFSAGVGNQMAITDDETGAKLPKSAGAWVYNRAMEIKPTD